MTACEYFPYTSKRHFFHEKRAADIAVKKALYHGTLTRLPCQRCGDVRSEAHHEDYGRPLDVAWLCRPHHRERDDEIARLKSDAEAWAQFSRRDTFPAVKEQAIATSREKGSMLGHPATERLVVQATTAVEKVMRSAGVSASDLAGQMGMSRSCISMKIDAGIRTLASLATMSDALGYEVHLELRRKADDEKA